MKRYLFWLLLSVVLWVGCGGDSPASPGDLVIEDVQANMALPSETGSVWLVIRNEMNEAETLTGAAVPGCGVVELHDMVMEDDVMMMREVAGGEIVIPAGETMELKKGGLHVMCMQKEGPLEVGSELEITLNFAVVGDWQVTATVVEPSGEQMDHGGHGG